MKVKIVVIGDLHFGIPDTERVYKELDQFLDYIKAEPDIDMIEFNGDYFDHKLSLNEPSALYALEFFSKVLNIAKDKNIAIRFIEGTQSHDRFQPRVLENFILNEEGEAVVDYKFFETVGTEDFKGVRILYVPEEYPLNIDEYYAPYKENQYHLMLVHGQWDFINFGGNDKNARNDINTAPIFKTKEWEHALEYGLSVSGHIHGRHGFKTKDGTKVIYPGSFSAWSFDQISKRGFAQVIVDTETNKVEYKLIDNTQAPTYANLDIKDLGLNLETADLDTIKNKIQEQKNKVNFLKVNLDALPEDKKLILKEFYKNNKDIRTESSAKSILLAEGANAEKYKKYDYLLEDKLPIEKMIQRFIKEEFQKDISEDKVKEIIKE